MLEHVYLVFLGSDLRELDCKSFLLYSGSVSCSLSLHGCPSIDTILIVVLYEIRVTISVSRDLLHGLLGMESHVVR